MFFFTQNYCINWQPEFHFLHWPRLFNCCIRYRFSIDTEVPEAGIVPKQKFWYWSNPTRQSENMHSCALPFVIGESSKRIRDGNIYYLQHNVWISILALFSVEATIPIVLHLKSQGEFKIHWVKTVTYTKGPAHPLKVVRMNGCGVVWCIMSGFC